MNIPETAVETPTFKRINGRWHVAQLCLVCRERIFRDVSRAPLTSATPPYCDKCQSDAGVARAVSA